MPLNRLASLSVALVLSVAGSLTTAADNPSVLVRTTPIVAKTVAQTLTTFGVLDPDPDRILNISLPHAGLINRVWVRLGQRVKSGDQLLEVVTAPGARMQYLQARSLVDYAQRELGRQRRLLEGQLATRSQVDAAKKNLKDARATQEALQKRGMDVVEKTLRAPMDGIVTRLDVSQGERVPADTTAMLIAAEQKLIARLGVEPEDLAAVQTGTAVTITSVFVPGVKVESTIREVHAMLNPSTHLVEVLAPIPEQQISQLVLGSRILGEIHLASHTALVVPRSAVLGDAPDAYLYTVNEGKARYVPVQTGGNINDLIEVSGNLKVGDRVVVSGNYQLTDGMAVRESP